MPPALTISITEAEFEWAWHSRPRKAMAIFMPKPGTELDRLLEQRAARQSEGGKMRRLIFASASKA